MGDAAGEMRELRGVKEGMKTEVELRVIVT